MRLYIKRGDVVIIVAIAVISIVMLVLQASFSDSNGKLYVVIFCGDGREQYPLDEDRTVTLKNEGYTLTAEIKDGHVKVAAADCPDRVCLKTAPISSGSGYIACVPAKILIKIIKDGGDDVDIIIG
jgi:hypothetical protein